MLHFQAHQAVVPSIGWFNGMYFPEACQTVVGRNHVKRRVPQSKKHKTWEGDGVLVVTRPMGVLMDLEGRVYVSNFLTLGTRRLRLVL